jgi:CBS domain-containing protein
VLVSYVLIEEVEMEVADVMTKELTSVLPDAPATEAVELLLKMQISGLPVIDENHKLVGMFTEKEVLAGILPSYVDKVGSFTYQDNPKAVKQKVINMRGQRVKDMMRRNVITIKEDAKLCEAARLMLIQKCRRLLVLNGAGEVTGIVSLGDVVKALFQDLPVSDQA